MRNHWLNMNRFECTLLSPQRNPAVRIKDVVTANGNLRLVMSASNYTAFWSGLTFRMNDSFRIALYLEPTSGCVCNVKLSSVFRWSSSGITHVTFTVDDNDAYCHIEKELKYLRP